MDPIYLIIGAIVPLFLLGLLGCYVAIASIRRGEFLFRGGRWIRGHDGWGFWIMVSLAAIAGLSTMLAAVWFGIRTIHERF